MHISFGPRQQQFDLLGRIGGDNDDKVNTNTQHLGHNLHAMPHKELKSQRVETQYTAVYLCDVTLVARVRGLMALVAWQQGSTDSASQSMFKRYKIGPTALETEHSDLILLARRYKYELTSH